MIRFLALVTGCLMFASAANAQVPPSFGICAACHSTDGSSRVGPSLQGVYGRKAGSLAGFAYSRAMRDSAAVWDESSLDAFIAEPQKAIPRNTMPFGGMPDPKQRSEIVDYLKALQ